MAFQLEPYLKERRALVEAELKKVYPDGSPQALREATEYSLLAGGKRLRPILALAAAEAVGGRAEDALAPALALEMIHSYSLIHDDLPAMDNDDLRRGRPTNHKVYGEGMAILAGDALLTDAFYVIGKVAKQVSGSDGGALGSRAARCVLEVAHAAGSAGMVGGQVLDIQATGKKQTEQQLVDIHRMKTGALFVAAVVCGAIMGGANPDTVERLRRFAQHAGLGFQIIDDVLDVTQDSATLGKPQGSDAAAGKTTYVDVLGIDGAKARAADCLKKALAEIDALGANAQALSAIAKYLIDRDR
ncbi:MAG: polyprenyl synthetase family protein [Deltaproteobacteria bacterium]|nr:polyprenyl synthetase family protein [Deltaproteobacteria bacterium]